jgi:tetratricopeptide (TPR) repeat protein
MIYDARQKYDKAKEHYQKALKINPNFAPAANNLAYLFAETGENIDIALNLAQSATQQFPDDPGISDILGWVYYKKNIFSRAIVYLKEANEKIIDNTTMRYHLGMAYYKNGEKENARRELKKALELGSKFQWVGEGKEVLLKLK